MFWIVFAILLLIFGGIMFLFPDSTDMMMSAVLSQEQINSVNSATTASVPYVAEPVNLIPILPFVIGGFILIMLFALAPRK